MMSQRSKKELIEAIRPRYLKADKAEQEKNKFWMNWLPQPAIIANMPFGCSNTVIRLKGTER